ncbi:hypothetical protein [Faecalibacillus intestinalis]|uniref:hypothetical protein n=1 Tax=Faecalibacillus intestinalis TaxID=1982626 RepID=UPI0039933356
MIYAEIIQNDREISLKRASVYKHSKNLTFKFIRDSNYSDYVLQGFVRIGTKEYLLEMKDDDTFVLNESYFSNERSVAFSFALTKNEEIIHLGVVSLRVLSTFGNTATPLEEHPEAWELTVEKKVDAYFEANYKAQLKVFQEQKQEVDVKHQEVLKTSETVAKTSDNISNIANVIKQDKSDIDSQVEVFNEDVNTFKNDYAQRVNDFDTDYKNKVATLDKLDVTIKQEINDLANTSKGEISSLSTQAKQDLSKQEVDISNKLNQQYTKFDELINRLDALGLTVVDGNICMEGD